MTLSRTLTTVVGAVALATSLSAPAEAGQRGRDRGAGSRGRAVAAPRAVPRGTVRPGRIYRNYGGRVLPSRAYPYRGYRGFGPGPRFNFFYGYPGFYGPMVWGAPYWGGAYWGSSYWYGSPYVYGGSPYAYGDPYLAGRVDDDRQSGRAPVRAYGGVRIDLPQRDAEVLVDGYYVGIVGDFDGVSQQLELEAGVHRVEIRLEGFEPVLFDVDVQPGRTTTYRTRLRPLP